MTIPADRGSAPDDFLIARGGPFYDLQVRLKLLHRHNLAAGRRALVFTAVAWLPLALLCLLGGTALGSIEERPFLLDFSAYARFILAIAVFVLMEPIAEARLRQLVDHFVKSGVLPRDQQPAAAAAMVTALRRRDSRVAEIVALVVAYALAIAVVAIALAGGQASWAVAATEGGVRLTLAGWWYLLVSEPFFFFLVVRWIWRFVVWGNLLRDFAGLDLRLAVTHPDGAGGLVFIGQYPPVFSAFVFALSSVFAAAAAKAILFAGVDFHLFLYVMAAWLVVMVVAFLWPLTAFVAPLGRFKKRALLEYSALASRAYRAAETGWLGRAEDDQQKAPETASKGDLGGAYQAARKMSTLPWSKESVLPITYAVVAPMIAVGSTQLPFKELLKFASRLLI